MSKETVYIAGQVTGLDYDQVRKKFKDAADQLKAMGFKVFNPCEHCDENTEWKQAMKTCLAALLECDYIHLLHDWNQSKGAVIERNLAQVLDIPTINIEKGGIS